MEPSKPPIPTLNLGLLLHLGNQYKDQLIGQYFAGTGITAPQFKVLINVYRGNTSPKDICRLMQMDTGAMSRMLERMVKACLVERHPHPHDKRQLILALTAKGLSLCQTFQDGVLRSIIGDLTARLTPQEAETLEALLIKMLPDETIASHR